MTSEEEGTLLRYLREGQDDKAELLLLPMTEDELHDLAAAGLAMIVYVRQTIETKRGARRRVVSA